MSCQTLTHVGYHTHLQSKVLVLRWFRVYLIFLVFNILQVRAFKPEIVALRDESKIDELKEALAGIEHKPEIIPGEQGVIEVKIFICFILHMYDQVMDPPSFFSFSEYYLFFLSGCSSP